MLARDQESTHAHTYSSTGAGAGQGGIRAGAGGCGSAGCPRVVGFKPWECRKVCTLNRRRGVGSLARDGLEAARVWRVRAATPAGSRNRHRRCPSGGTVHARHGGSRLAVCGIIPKWGQTLRRAVTAAETGAAGRLHVCTVWAREMPIEVGESAALWTARLPYLFCWDTRGSSVVAAADAASEQPVLERWSDGGPSHRYRSLKQRGQIRSCESTRKQVRNG